MGHGHDKTSSGSHLGKSQTDWSGSKKCFQREKFGHLMYNCPDRQVKPSVSCDEVAWT